MELIDKKTLLEEIDKIPCWECDGPCIDECHACVTERVKKATPVKLLQCKDCLHFKNGIIFGLCGLSGKIVRGKYFCYKGHVRIEWVEVKKNV